MMNTNYNYITVGFKTTTQRSITSKHPFFRGELIVKIDDEKITFTKPDLSYMGKTYKPFANKKTGFLNTAIMCDIPLGKYEFDKEESNEDKIVVYYAPIEEQEN